ncbi:hypothetical protein LLH00_12470 [bacterium]|nr:hypothetical protein [bacterium]
MQRYLRKMALVSVALLALLVAAETAARVKYFHLHDEDLFYLLTPFIKVAQTQRPQHGLFIPEKELLALGLEPKESSWGSEGRFERPCRDRTVFSPLRNDIIPCRYNAYCWRGREVTLAKPDSVFRILTVGGSTVESEDIGDDDLFTTRLEDRLNADPGPAGRFQVLNAGHSAYDSRQIDELLNYKGFLFRPDLVLYYEAINEQINALEWFTINRKIKALGDTFIGPLHRALYMNSMLYTYAVEKYFYLQRESTTRWNFDETQTRRVFSDIIEDCRAHGAEFVYVTQVIDFPLREGALDLNCEAALRTALDSLNRAAAAGSRDQALWNRISAMNQRLINLIQVGICREKGAPVVDVLEVFDRQRGDGVRYFKDLVHKTCFGDSLLAEGIYSRLKPLIDTTSAANAAAVPPR